MIKPNRSKFHHKRLWFCLIIAAFLLWLQCMFSLMVYTRGYADGLHNLYIKQTEEAVNDFLDRVQKKATAKKPNP